MLTNGLTAGIDFKFKSSSIEWHKKVSIKSKHCIKVSLRCLVVHQTAFCYIPIPSRMPFIVILPVSFFFNSFKKYSFDDNLEENRELYRKWGARVFFKLFFNF